MDGNKEQSIKLLKEALNLIHDFFERTKNSKPEESEQITKDRVRMQKYLRYVLDQVRHIIITFFNIMIFLYL